MTAKKQKEKERRRARKLAEQAWEAANEHNLDLAEKIIRRAVATQPENPVLWNDQGMLLRLKSKEDQAEEAFRAAISLAPAYAEPYAHLADIRMRQGYVQDGVALIENAVRFAPHVAEYAERLAAYRALVAHHPEFSQKPTNPSPRVPVGPEAELPGTKLGEWPFGQQLTKLAWPELGERLTREGCVMIPALLDGTTCAQLRGMFENDELFAKTVAMDREEFGRGVYRYFRAPIPPIVDALRRAVYPHVARIANEWQSLLNEPDPFPEGWESFRDICREAGQTTPTPILLRYGPGGFNALHRDLRGTVFFPIQMAVVLSPQAVGSDPNAEGFRGGEFLFCDVPERTKSRRRMVPAGLGDTLLFCTRDRLVPIGGAYGLQPVKHGVNKITEGSRVVLGVPFHEYR